MIDKDYLSKINLVTTPMLQNVLATLLLMPNYNLFAKVRIEVEHMERIPRDETVIFAMNHTDRYNYWPFQYKMWRSGEFPFTTVWVKAKYYRNTALAKVLNWCHMIPVPSMSYMIEETYRNRFKRKIDSGEYRAIRDLIEGKPEDQAISGLSQDLFAVRDNFAQFIRTHYEAVMNRVAELSRTALFEKGLNLIVFPEGTRSLKLAEGRTGIAQLAVHSRKKIVPVGCNNCETVYSGTLPFAKSGKVVYRVGEPISVNDALKPFQIGEKFRLFSKESQQKYRDQFEGATRVIMERINRMVDERYKHISE